jgi:phosphate transport system substrate-binding protein
VYKRQANAKWDAANGFYQVLTQQPGKTTWPISGASFILMHKEPKDASKALEVMKFFSWAYANGSQSAVDMDYVAIPSTVVKQVEAYWRASVKSAGQVLWK